MRKVFSAVCALAITFALPLYSQEAKSTAPREGKAAGARERRIERKECRGARNGRQCAGRGQNSAAAQEAKQAAPAQNTPAR